MPEPRATVVVVNWNGGHLLPSCLDALRRQTVRDAMLVWVVDNASSDGSRELLARDYPEVRVLANPDNRGFAGGNNTALREVTTPFAVLLNNDATPEPDWLERLLAPFDGPGGERLGAVTSKVLFAPEFARIPLRTKAFQPPGDSRDLGVKVHQVAVADVDVTDEVLWERVGYGREPGFRWTRPEGELLVPLPPAGAGEVSLTWSAETAKPVDLGGRQVTVGEEPSTVQVPVTSRTDVVNNAGSLVFVAGYGADRGFQEPDDGQYDEPADVFALCGCAVALRTEAGRALDWFDDDFFLYYEDTDLSWRLQAAGWGIRYEPTAVVRHIHSASSGEWSPTFTFYVTRNRLLMLAKDATWPRARHELVAFLADSAVMVRAALGRLVRGRRPDATALRMRLRVLRSLLRLLPVMLVRRRRLSRTAVVPREQLEQRLVTSR